jgi:hypothetical protein
MINEGHVFDAVTDNFFLQTSRPSPKAGPPEFPWVPHENGTDAQCGGENCSVVV